MESILFGEDPTTVDTVILIKNSALNFRSIESYYVKPLEELGINRKRLSAVSLHYSSDNKIKAKEAKIYINYLLENIPETITTLVVADSNYFKYITNKQKVTNCRGYIYKCVVPKYTHLDVILSVNYNAVFHNENQEKDLKLSISTIASHLGIDDHTVLGQNIIKKRMYPSSYEEIQTHLNNLLLKPVITCDIETYSLRFEKAGIGSIGFAWSTKEGSAFLVKNDPDIKALIKDFLLNYKGQLIWHNLLFDDKILIYNLFMEHASDWEGLEKGLAVAEKHDDSMVVAYLATNNAVENKLGLKELAYEYLGDWGVDVNDITQLTDEELLKYNLEDCVATFYVWEKYYPIMVKESQLDFYNNIAKPSLKVSLKMMLTGLPINMDKIDSVEKQIASISLKNKNFLKHNKTIKHANFLINKKDWQKANEKLKKKIRPLSEFNSVFNPNSNQQLQVLLYDVMKLPVLDTTKNKAPSTSAKVIKRVYNHPSAEKYLPILDSIIGISETDIILNTFLSAFKQYAFVRKTPNPEFNNTVWLNGNLKTTGTKSGRLSSSEPNLQNIPSGSAYGPLIKSCIVAPKGWVICGADYSSLEDRINALLTQDPNKIKVYSEGYDGHCLRAYSYYSEMMPDIDPTSVDSINSIADKYPKLRSRSKNPTFALTYMGTAYTLVKNLGFSEEEAKKIESNYHKLYEVSDLFSERCILKAANKGFLELAFGLRIRTPILAKTDMTQKMISSEAKAEGRTVNNAAGQSYGLLMNRAIIAFNKAIEKDSMYNDVLLLNTIHDAVYLLVKEDPKIIQWVNTYLIKEMRWNDLDPIRSDVIPMEAELDIGYSWDNQKTLKNEASLEEITQFMEELKNE